MADILKKVFRSIGNDNLAMVSAGLAFYLLLGIFPAVAALILIYGLAADPVQAQQQIQETASFMPAQAREILSSQMGEIAQRENQVGIGLAVTILLALWSATKASNALIKSLNMAFNEQESRGLGTQLLLRMGMMVAGVIIVILLIGLIVIIPPLLKAMNFGPVATAIIEVLRWLSMIGIFMGILAVLYRFVPDRKPPRWIWVAPGSVFATVFWILGSFGFSWYVANFGNYNETYGSIGGAIIFMLWLYLSGFIILIGAELNQQVEYKKRDDPEEPAKA